MPGTRWLAAARALTIAVLTMAVLVTRVLTTGVLTTEGTGPAPVTPAAAGMPGTTTVGATIRARLPAVAELDAVSCPSARLCMTVGSTPSRSTVVLRWNGTRWRMLPTPSGR